ncbi:hypothetical protein RB195_016599 [Necator americanus]|uniref:Uncharacterized protein n=1 Tax=Necator americanus TaxID=51031 RepID=A0ABR1C3T3_NECAM
MPDNQALQRRIRAANESAETFRIILRITVGLLIFTIVFTLLMFLHYKRAIALWPSLHPYHTALEGEEGEGVSTEVSNGNDN